MPPVSFHEIEKYADDNAGDLREMALLPYSGSLRRPVVKATV
jgi:hypothetical protein